MKRIIPLLIALFVLGGCTNQLVLKNTPETKKFYMLDFSSYTKKGFLFTPKSYTGEYESIGMVDYTFIPGAKNETRKEVKDGIYTDCYYWIEEPFTTYDLLDVVYSMCNAKGADALIDLKIEYKSESYGQGYVNPATISGLKISGYAIKRK